MTKYDNDNSGYSNNNSGSCPCWLRADCYEFYKTEFLQRQCGPKNNQMMIQQVKDRVSLLRSGINRAMVVKQRFRHAEFLEFGVHEGKDLVRMATFLKAIEDQQQEQRSRKNKSRGHQDTASYATTVFHGFDSFVGLPEDWMNGQLDANNQPFHKQGAFETGGKSPDVNSLVNHQLQLGRHHGRKPKCGGNNNEGKGNARANLSSSLSSPASESSTTTLTKSLDNIQFHKGWFHETLPTFLDEEQHTNQPIAFIHADADLYSSTIIFLKEICQRKLLKKGSIIIFDEYWNYPNWQDGEYKAWQEITIEFDIEYEYWGYHGAPFSSSQPTSTTTNAKTKIRRLKQYGYQSVGVVVTSDM